MFVLSLSY